MANGLSVGLAMLLTGCVFAAGARAGGSGELLSHRAIYEISLAPEKAKGVTAASGRIAFEFTGNACDGYALNFRQVTTLDDGEGRTKVLDMRSSTWEDAEGKKFRFNLKNLIDSQTTQQADGAAERGEDGGVSVALKAPQPIRIDLPGEPVFPTRDTFRLLEAARAGQRSLAVPVYDGSDGGQKPYDTTAIIGRPIEGRAAERLEPAVRDAGLGDEPRWPVSISYFDVGQRGDRTPAYVMSFDLLDNGVYSNIRFDFGDFALSARMSQLEKIKTDECRR